MAGEFQKALEFIEQAECAASIEELQAKLEAAFAWFGVPHYSLGAMLRDEQGGARFTTLVRGVTEAWAEHYWAEKSFNVDAAVHLALQRVTPFSWSEVEALRLPQASRRLFDEIREAMQIKGGLVIPIHDEMGFAGVVALHHEEHELRAKAAQALKLIAIYAVERAKELLAHVRSLEPANACPLSQRQREILAYAALGKSETDTGDILGISSFTVREHMAEARARLGVRTKMQAIALAVQRGWVHP
jgi:DNA-binding CsgD family transcriptional regulator